MLTSFNWLAERLDLSQHSLDELSDLLTFAGIEVEGIQEKGLSTNLVVVAQIKEATQHPDADRLKICQVDAGTESLHQIVCGAQNYQIGDKVPCALPGAVLPGNWEIKKGKLRGVESGGMLCGADEIGLPKDNDGLMILPPDSVVGTPLKELYANDTIIEIEVTPNRPDLLSHSGMARELGALAKLQLSLPTIPSPAPQETSSFIQNDSPERCPFYSAIRISGAKVNESPEWLRTKLESIGLRPINSVVDITNYVLHEMGQPLHAFDAAKINQGIQIRLASEGEKIKALDENEYLLQSDDLIIADQAGKAHAIAGVMGGFDSGVTNETTDLILESAYFAPSEIRRTSRRLILSSDSSYRFERGVDPKGVLAGSALAVKLICELTGGKVEPTTLISGEVPTVTQPVELDHARLAQLMDHSISLEEAEAILTSLGLSKINPTTWDIPSYRGDLQRHVDLVEEIARVHGLNNVPSRLLGSYSEENDIDRAYDAQMSMRRQLASLGFYEAQTIKLISDTQLHDCLPLRPLQEGDVIRVSLPLSEDHAVMRPSLTPGLITVAERNACQGASSLRFFEMGRTFRNAGGGKAKDLETDTLAILMAGDRRPSDWHGKKTTPIDLYDLKGVIASILPQSSIQLAPRQREGFVLSADILANGKPIGIFARLSPSRCRELSFETPVCLAELDLKKLQQLRTGIDQVEELPQFPGSSRDIAMEAPADLENAQIEKAILKANQAILESYYCFDLFTDPSGEKLAVDRKSIAYSLTYRSPDRTLKGKEVDEVHAKILEHLQKTLPISYR